MPIIDETITVARPRQEVFDFFIDPASIALYSSNIIEYEHISGDVDAVGRVDRGAVKVAGRRLEFTSQTLEIEPGVRLLQRSTDAKIPFTLEIKFDEDGDGTKITWHQETDPLGGFFGKLGDAVVVKMYSRDVQSNLDKAKTLLES